MAFSSHLNTGFGEPPESAEALMAQPGVPLVSLAYGLLHEGLAIPGGQHVADKHRQYPNPEDERVQASSRLRQDMLDLFDVTGGAMRDDMCEIFSHSLGIYRETIRSLASLLRE